SALRSKSIALAPDGLDVLRGLWIVFQLLPQPCHVCVDGSRGSFARIFPHLLHDLVTWHHPLAVIDQILEQLELLGREVDRTPVFSYLRAFEIDLDIAEAKRLKRSRHGLPRPAQQG